MYLNIMKMAIIALGLILIITACGNNTASHKTSSTSDSSKIDTAAAKDLDTAAEIIGGGMVHP
jgi:ABC-type enterochelin transport system substrate-binding protein